MALLTPSDFINQMVQQLRALDPNISAAEGTPEYKIIATVAEALSQSQIDLNVSNSSFDLNSKYGTNLDSFMQMFGFGRQAAIASKGLVTFSRETATTTDLFVPEGKQIASSDDIRVIYETTASVTLPAGETNVSAPVRALTPGEIGNKPANVITDFVDAPILGISGVTNKAPVTGGVDRELDDEYKARFRNTVFRNLAGTEDQYLATAVNSYSTKATVIGPISKHVEVIQIPSVDDATAYNGISGKGNSGEYTSALSSVVYSKYTYPESFYISNVDRSLFYSPDADFVVNCNVPGELKNKGDTYRMAQTNKGPDVAEYSAKYFWQPNITFVNIKTDSDANTLSPEDTVVMQHDYISTASRNDWDRGITNCVDIFVNNENPVSADSIIPRPGNHVFNLIPGNRLNVENFRRSGQSQIRPRVGNFYSPLLWQPVTSLPDSITVGLTTYFLGEHYWLVKNVDLGGTTRSRDGIEWASNVNGELISDVGTYSYGGSTIGSNPERNITINDYFFDQNIVKVQSSIDDSRPVTTDVLVHQGKTRYFKFNFTVMYNSGSNPDDTNDLISSALSKVMGSTYFGATIQLSDVLQQVHNVAGVDNVRWSSDSNPTIHKVLECDADGRPLLNVDIGQQATKYYVCLTGSPTKGQFRLSLDNFKTEYMPYNVTALNLKKEIGIAYGSATVNGSGTAMDPFVVTLPNSTIDVKSEMHPTDPLSYDSNGGPFAFNEDFYLRDDELPSLPKQEYGTDSAIGLVIEKRVQNTWNKA